MLRPSLLLVVLLGSLVLLAAGCTGANDDDDSSGSTAGDGSGTAAAGANNAATATPSPDLPTDETGNASATATPVDDMDGGGGAEQPSPEPARDQVASVESQCGGEMPPEISPGESNPLVLESGGQERTLLLYVPSGYDPSEPMPLVLNFHGAGGQALQQEQASGFVPLAEQEGFLLATPDGLGDPRRWEFALDAPDNSIQFAEDLTDRLAADFCIDPARVYSAGFSNGAFLSSALACAMPERIAGIAAVGGIYLPGDICTAAIPTIAFHGTDDTVVPFDGGTVEALGGLAYPGVRQVLADWAEVGDCNPIPYPSQFAEAASRGGYDGCEGGFSLELIALDGFGHGWPTPENSSISAAELTWEFFERHQQ